MGSWARFDNDDEFALVVRWGVRATPPPPPSSGGGVVVAVPTLLLLLLCCCMTMLMMGCCSTMVAPVDMMETDGQRMDGCFRPGCRARLLFLSLTHTPELKCAPARSRHERSGGHPNVVVKNCVRLAYQRSFITKMSHVYLLQPRRLSCQRVDIRESEFLRHAPSAPPRKRPSLVRHISRPTTGSRRFVLRCVPILTTLFDDPKNPTFRPLCPPPARIPERFGQDGFFSFLFLLLLLKGRLLYHTHYCWMSGGRTMKQNMERE